MRIPFPLALSLGTDIVAYHRFIKPCGSPSSHLERLARRFLHPEELAELNRRHQGWTNIEKLDELQQQRVGAWLAGRWAAKEAAKKAWGASLISFKDVRTEVLETGEVHILCKPFDEPMGDVPPSLVIEQAAKLSISHDGEYAVATVIASPLDSRILAELHTRKEAAMLKVKRK